jgi:AraC family transcriptional regulator
MPVQPRLLNLSTFINEHLREELTLEVLAQRMNLSPFHFHRKFRAYFGESLHQHIKRLRLERSAYALLYRLTPVSTVAKNSGYKTLSAFSHAFSAHFGVAPTRFREVMMKGRLADQASAIRERLASAGLDRLVPARIENLPERHMSFIRAEVKANGSLDSVCAALSEWNSLNGSAASTTSESSEVVISTVDLFGLLTGAGFRVDIGRESHGSDGQRSQTGSSSLPRGRYAVFEFRAAPERIVDILYGIYHQWLPDSSESVRAQPHYLTFNHDGEREPRFKLQVPLEEVATLSRDEAVSSAVTLSAAPETAHS